MSFAESIVESDPSLQGFIKKLKKATSLALMVLTILQFVRVIAVKIIEEELNERGQAPTKWPCCGKCGKRLNSKGLLSRKMLTLIGPIKWWRRIGRCPNKCKIGQVVPLDEALGLTAHQKSSIELKWVSCALAVFVPFETASVLLSLLTGVKVCGKSIWVWVQGVGQQAMDQLTRQLEALDQGIFPEVEAMEAHIKTLPLLIGADGVMVPFRANGGNPQGRTIWREVKVGILARLGQRLSGAGRLIQRRLAAVLGSVDDFEPRLWIEAMRQGIKEAKCVVWLSDGGVGFWGIYYRRFAAYAIGILDFYHAAQNLWKGAKSWLDGRTHQAREWFAKTRRRLRSGDANKVIAEIKATLSLQGLPASTYKTLTNLYIYLKTHQDHIDYTQFEKLGLPLGSGMVESACKWLIQQRFKGVGMRWSEEGFNHLLHLRLAWVNGRFDQLFSLEDSPN
jgi:hypothetical protein